MTNEDGLLKFKSLEDSDKKVVIVDVSIPFWSMVKLLITISVAAIPAFIFLVIFYMTVTSLFSLTN